MPEAIAICHAHSLFRVVIEHAFTKDEMYVLTLATDIQVFRSDEDFYSYAPETQNLLEVAAENEWEDYVVDRIIVNAPTR